MGIEIDFENLILRRARESDLFHIVELIADDELGSSREILSEKLDNRYLNAFHKIDKDENQYLAVVEYNGEIVATFQMTLIPYLTFIGSTRMQIENVHVSGKYRGAGIGEWMMKRAIEYGKSHGATIIQLTTNKKRSRARKFYEKLGFEASHEGMKLYF